MSFGILRESSYPTTQSIFGSQNFIECENTKSSGDEISNIRNDFDKAPGAPVRCQERSNSSPFKNSHTLSSMTPGKTLQNSNMGTSLLNCQHQQMGNVNTLLKSHGSEGSLMSSSPNLIHQNSSITHTNKSGKNCPIVSGQRTQFLFNNNNYQIQHFKPHSQYNNQQKQTQQGTANGLRNAFIIQTKPPVQQVSPIVATRPYINQGSSMQHKILPNYQNTAQNRRNRSVQQTNLHNALSDCQEQFNDLKSELKIRKHCERDNLKTEELCFQLETSVISELMYKLEKCNEKHWEHLEAEVRRKIENCKEARMKEKKVANTFGSRVAALDSATEVVTDSLTELTRCLRICRTLLWASQVPLQEYPPRLGYRDARHN